ncbi:methyltransferase domain-containing protein [Pseudorhizobium flavum]|uniref:methyltransferase domain-containing protein n=1 Tax=Pseudorhizobium flavum TaxID=1335061 RepID=UPI00376FF57B
MSGFDKDWLALRETADQATRDMGLVEELATYLQGMDRPFILDIGCGTGSTLRSLKDHLPRYAGWLLLDYDPLLLEEASRRAGTNAHVTFRQHDLNDINALPLEGVSVVTASALFDLCSDGFCAALADRLAAAGCGLYAALNYDGVMRWSPEHPLDGQMTDLFNRHQRTDKGFGPALGPDATACLAKHLKARGFTVTTAESPWRLDQSSAALQTEFLGGLRQPLLEASELPDTTIDNWLDFRLAAIGTPGASCLIGHCDLLALPG